MPLFITPRAEQDIESIGDYIASDNPRRAISFIRELHEQCRKIAAQPQSYRRRPELSDDLRSCAYGSYVIFFSTEDDMVRIIRVLHGAMDIPQQLQETKN